MPSSLGQLVGPRGANIREIESSTGARVTVDDDGIVRVYATSAHAARRAMAMVQQSAGVLRARKLYRATITGVKDFGAFARVNEANEGLIPAQEIPLKSGQRLHEALPEGTPVVVEVLGTDGRGRLRLSLVEQADEALIEY